MGVSIEVDLDLDIEDDIAKIREEIESLESIDLSDIDLEGLEDMDVSIDEDNELNQFADDIDRIPDTVTVNVRQSGYVSVPSSTTMDVHPNFKDDELPDLSESGEFNFDGLDTTNKWLSDIHNRLESIEWILKSKSFAGSTDVSVSTNLSEIGADEGTDTVDFQEVSFDTEGETISTTPISQMAGFEENHISFEHTPVNFKGLNSRVVGEGGSLEDVAKHKGLSKLSNSLESARDAGSSFLGVLDKIRPTFAGLYAVLATLLPALGALYVQLGGLATAFGALGAAGGAIALLGAFGGEAETMKGAVKGLEQQIKSFKREMFQVFEPVADTFAPIFDRFLNRVIQGMGEVRDELRGLEVFKGIFFELLGPFTNALERTIQYAIQLAPAIKDAARNIGKFIANNAPEFLRGLTVEGLRSLDTLARLGKIVFQVGRALYGLFQTVLNVASIFSSFSWIISLIADFLNSKFVQVLAVIIGSLASFVGVVWLVVTAMTALLNALILNGSIMGWLASTSIARFITSLYSSLVAIYQVTAAIWGANAALSVMAALVATIIAGLSLILAGASSAISDILSPDIDQNLSPSASGSFGGGGGGGSGGDVNINIQGDADDESIQEMKDVAGRLNRKEKLQNGTFV